MLNLVGGLLLKLHRGCRKQAAEAFPGWAMALVRKVIPNSAWLWGSGTVVDGEVIAHSFLFDNVPPEAMQTWERYKHLDIFTTRHAEQRNVVHNDTYEMLKSTEIYHRFYHTIGIEQILGIHADKTSSGLYDAIKLFRSDPTAPFSEEERLAMQCLVPHLIEARHANYLERLSTGTPHAQQQSLAVADGKGVIHVAEEGFVKLMRLEWPQWHDPRLPAPLTKGYGATAHRYEGRAIIVCFVLVLDMFLLKARPRTPVYCLSKRELEIARHFADGLTQKEIAREIALAPATVSNNLSAIYLKLGINPDCPLEKFREQCAGRISVDSLMDTIRESYKNQYINQAIRECS